VTVTGPLDALAIAGDLRITRAEVRLVDATPPRIVELQPLSWVGEPLPEAGAGTPGGAALDIRVSAPERIYVRGRGLDSEWRLDLTVGGTTDEPRLRGSIERIRGRFDLIGKAFDLREGAIRFDGGPGIDPTISIVLERAQADLTGRIIVSGSAMRPEIAFSSTPALPEDEVLPRLLFGTSRQALTAAQALQLALGLRTLMSGESGPLDVARQTLGIDVLQVDPSLEGDISVTVGKTVAPGVFVGARQELSGDGNTTATVEVEIFPNVKITGEAGPERQRIGIGWERDF
jgi:translocation and assembly module TamB